MLPVVAGERETKRQMLLYTGVLLPATLVPVATGLSGIPYGIAAVVLGAFFVRHLWRLWREDGVRSARPLFGYSILYLFLIFVALLVDRAVAGLIP